MYIFKVLPLTYFLLILTAIQAKANYEILRNTDGSYRRMSFFEASGINPQTRKKEKQDVCEIAGQGHLPTIRELILEYNPRCAKGIIEYPAKNPAQVIRGGYMKIVSDNTTSEVDVFYYNYAYCPYTDKHLRFWSSSVNSYTYSSIDGYVDHFIPLDDENYILCILPN